MSIQSKIRATSETVVCDSEIQHQRYRARRVGKLGRHFNIPTMLTHAFSYVLCLDLCVVRKRSASCSTTKFIFATSHGLHVVVNAYSLKVKIHSNVAVKPLDLSKTSILRMRKRISHSMLRH